MLVLTRKKEETIRIGDNITIKIIDLDNRQVKLGIEAPKHVAINREEIYLRILAENEAASKTHAAHAGEGLMLMAGMLKNKNPGTTDKG
jgi:carbon storage regulator